MKAVYPVIISPKESDGLHLVTVPDLDGAMTQGHDVAEAMYMARDLIGLTCVYMEDDIKTPLPASSALEAIAHEPGDIVTLVDIDLDDYRRSIEEKTVRRNVSLPSWMDYRAAKAGINVSALLQEALAKELNIPTSRKKREKLYTTEHQQPTAMRQEAAR